MLTMLKDSHPIARKAHESHIANGTYPAKGWYSPNLQKGKQFEFKAKTTNWNND